MKEKTVEVKNKIIMYIAEDGTEFKSSDECERHEDEVLLNRYADKYKMKFISVPTFICDDDCFMHGISFYFPQDGNEDEVIKLLSIYQNYEISKYCDGLKIDFSRNLSNVHDSDFEIKMPSLNKGDNYIFYFSWKEYSDDWDYFHNQVVSKEKARKTLENETSEFEKLFNTEWNKENTKLKETITKLNRCHLIKELRKRIVRSESIIKRLLMNRPDTYSGTDVMTNQTKMFAFDSAVNDAIEYLKETENDR